MPSLPDRTLFLTLKFSLKRSGGLRSRFLRVNLVRFVFKVFRQFQERLAPFGAVGFLGDPAAMAGPLAESFGIGARHPC